MLENEYIEGLVDKFNEIIASANLAKDEYVNLGQIYAEGEKTQDSTTKSKDENLVEDLESELEKIENTTYDDYLKTAVGAPTEEEFEEWKNTRVEIMKKNIEQEKARREEEQNKENETIFNDAQKNMDENDNKYNEMIETLKKDVNKINAQIERTEKRIQIRIDELDEEIKELVEELMETQEKDKKINLSKQLEKYRSMKISYESNLNSIKDIKDLPNKILDSIEDYDVVEGLIKEANEKIAEVEGRLSRQTNEIEVNVVYNKETGKYVVNCKCGSFELKPGKEYTQEELTKENIGKLLKGFAGALADNRVSLSKDGKVFMKTSFANAASELVSAAQTMSKTQDGPTQDEPQPDQPKPEEPTQDAPKPDEPTSDQPQPDQPTADQPTQDEPQPDEPKPDEPTQDEPQPEVQDAVVLKVLKTRNRNKKIMHAIQAGGVAVGLTTMAVASMSLLGIPVIAVSTLGAKAFFDGALAYKNYKIRKTLSKIAQDNGVLVKVDKETKSVYFCMSDDLSTRITPADLENPNPDVREIATSLQTALDREFKNSERDIANEEQRKAYLENDSFIQPRVAPLAVCNKVTLDNLEAAYQQLGGVYSYKDDRKTNEKGNRYKNEFDESKIASNYAKSIQPEENTESPEVNMDDLDNFMRDKEAQEKEEDEKNRKAEQNTADASKEETEEQEETQENSNSGESKEKEEENEESKGETQEQPEEEMTEEEKKEESPEQNTQTEQPEASSDEEVKDVDEISNASELQDAIIDPNVLNSFLDGIDVDSKLKANGGKINKNDSFEDLESELEETAEETKGMKM